MEIPKQGYTVEFRERVVKRVKDGPRVGTVGKALGLTLRHWVKAAEGTLKGAGGGPRRVRGSRSERQR